MNVWLSDPSDIAELVRWLLALVLSGWLALPMTMRLTPNLAPSAQVVLAKILGWCVAGYAGWLASSFGLSVFHAQAGLVALLALGGLWVAGRGGAVIDWRTVARIEGFFVVLFIFGLGQRLVFADLTGLEKPTNLGFLSALLQTDRMPPEDVWFAGRGINYYYLGHATVAVFAQMTAISADHAYQLGMATLFAMTGTGIGAVVFAALVPVGRHIATALAGLSGLAALYAGNLHSFLYTILRPLMPTNHPEFYYPDSTRFIGFDPATDDHAFTEFTGYAFRVGDLHAHVLATPIFLAGMLMLLSLLRDRVAGARPGFGPAIALGVLLGLLYGTNAWDVPILGLGALGVWGALVVLGGRAEMDRMAALAVTSLAIAVATAIPFAANFSPFGEGIAAAGAQTPFWQLIVVHGVALPALIAIAVLCVGRQWSVTLSLAIGLAIWGLCLIALPELVRVEDIYGQDHARANTMFKLTFRSQTILLIATAVVAGILVTHRARIATIGALVVVAPVIAAFSYAYDTFYLPRAGQGLDGLNHIGARIELVRYLEATPWPEGASFIEAPSNSFTEGAVLATASGRPSVLGWASHAHLWHAAPGPAWRRYDEIAAFYEGTNLPEQCRFLRRYNVAYIAFTEAERLRFPDLRPDDLTRFGYVALDAPGGLLIRVRPELCDTGSAE